MVNEDVSHYYKGGSCLAVTVIVDEKGEILTAYPIFDDLWDITT